MSPADRNLATRCETIVEIFIANTECFVRLLLAVVAGAIIGWERERHDKPAGLRTHMMVALGSAAFMVATIEFCKTFAVDGVEIRLDPIRAVAGIIGGVGFLGAGTIIQARGSVRGITTAASIWVAAAIGIACGMGLYAIALSCVVLALLILVVLGALEHRAFSARGQSPAMQRDSHSGDDPTPGID